MSKSTAVHALSAVLASVILVAPVRPVAPAAFADGAVAIYPVPPAPSPEAVDAAAHLLGNPLNKPVTGAAEVPSARHLWRRCRRSGPVRREEIPAWNQGARRSFIKRL